MQHLKSIRGLGVVLALCALAGAASGEEIQAAVDAAIAETGATTESAT